MAALMVGSAWLAAGDKISRERDETHVLPTAIGETRLHSSGPGPLAPELLGMPMAIYQGKALYLQGRVTREMRAIHMEKAGETDSGETGVYRHAPKAGRGEPEPGLFLLVGFVPGNPERGLFRPVGYERKYGGPDEPAEGGAGGVANP